MVLNLTDIGLSTSVSFGMVSASSGVSYHKGFTSKLSYANKDELVQVTHEISGSVRPGGVTAAAILIYRAPGIIPALAPVAAPLLAR